MDDETNRAVNEIENILSLLEQSPYNPQSDSYQQKLRDAIRKIESIGGNMNMTGLIEELQDRLI